MQPVLDAAEVSARRLWSVADELAAALRAAEGLGVFEVSASEVAVMQGRAFVTNREGVALLETVVAADGFVLGGVSADGSDFGGVRYRYWADRVRAEGGGVSLTGVPAAEVGLVASILVAAVVDRAERASVGSPDYYGAFRDLHGLSEQAAGLGAAAQVVLGDEFVSAGLSVGDDPVLSAALVGQGIALVDNGDRGRVRAMVDALAAEPFVIDGEAFDGLERLVGALDLADEHLPAFADAAVTSGSDLSSLTGQGSSIAGIDPVFVDYVWRADAADRLVAAVLVPSFDGERLSPGGVELFDLVATEMRAGGRQAAVGTDGVADPVRLGVRREFGLGLTLQRAAVASSPGFDGSLGGRVAHAVAWPASGDRRVDLLRWLFPIAPSGGVDVGRSMADGTSQDVATSAAAELDALQALQLARFMKPLPNAEPPALSDDQVLLLVELEQLWAGLGAVSQEAVGSFAADSGSAMSIDPAWVAPNRFHVLLMVASGEIATLDGEPVTPAVQALAEELTAPTNSVLWETLAAARTDTWFSPEGEFQPVAGAADDMIAAPDNRLSDNVFTRLQTQLGFQQLFGAHAADLAGTDGVVTQDSVTKWLEANEHAIDPIVADRLRLARDYGLGEDRFGWDEIATGLGLTGIALAAFVTIAYTGGSAVPLWATYGLGGTAAVESYAAYKAGDSTGAALAAAGAAADTATLGRYLYQTLNTADAATDLTRLHDPLDALPIHLLRDPAYGANVTKGYDPNLLEAALPGLDDLYRRAPDAKAEIDEVADSYRLVYGGRVLKAGIKGRERAMEKIVKDYAGDASEISDLARNTLIVPHNKVDEVVAVISGDPELNVLQVTDLSKKSDLGYEGFNIRVEIDEGIMAEMRINSPVMIYTDHPEWHVRETLSDELYERLDAKAKEHNLVGGIGHDYYERYRSLAHDDPDRAVLRAISNEYYDLMRKYLGHIGVAG